MKEVSTAKKKIPEVTILRLVLYRRSLEELLNKRVDFVTSSQLGKMSGINSNQVRRDFAYLGRFGSRGIGYLVEGLSQAIKKILGLDRKWKIALVGCGNLGRALIGYPGFLRSGFEITAIFDSNPTKIGEIIHDKRILPAEGMARVIKNKKIKIGIVAVPAFAAQKVCSQLVKSGVRAILNFAPVKLVVPLKVKLRNVDLAADLGSLSSFLVVPHLW